jgi:hypothetical protein
MRTNARQRHMQSIQPWETEFFRFTGGFVLILGCALILLFIFEFILS